MLSKIITLMVLISSVSVLSNHNTLPYDGPCLTHGECQQTNVTAPGEKCLLLKTGFNHHGQVTCAISCYNVRVAYYCKGVRRHKVGRCTQESYSMPTFDPANPDCSSAVDPHSF